MLFLGLVIVLVAVGEEEPDSKVSTIAQQPIEIPPAWSISEVHEHYNDIKGERLRITGFAGMSGQDFWILQGMTHHREDQMTPLNEIVSANASLWLWLSWADWTDNPGFEASGNITARCKVGNWQFDSSGNGLDGIEMNDCELDY